MEMRIISLIKAGSLTSFLCFLDESYLVQKEKEKDVNEPLV